MATNRITKAFLPLEQRTISIEEYGKYLDGKTRWISLRNNIFCPECGDALVYAKGEIYSPYFKHSPSAQGHNYCCLYNRGYESKCWESIIRKRIFQGKDISFNYVVRYWSNSWSNYVTVPSFSEEEISINEKNNTKIQIEYGKSVRDKTIINVDSGTFYPGKIKKIKLPEIASVLSITVSGNNESHNIVLDGFKAGSQIYKYLLDQDYGNQNFTVFQKETFALKRVSGKIYTGRHYVIFVNEFSKKPDIKEYREYGIELNEVNIPKLKIDKWMNYLIYDVYFTNECFDRGYVKPFVEEFCSNRGCLLVKESEAVIVWPPVNSVENYRYFDIGDKVYLFSATEENILLKQIRAKGITFFIQNTNSSKMYVTQGEGEDFELKEGKYEIEESQHVDTKEKYGYFLKDGVLVEKIKGIKKLLNNDSVAIYANMLNRKIIQNKEKKNTKILHAIRYGIRIEEYNNTIHEKLLDIYNIDETIKGYLNICLEKGYIKSEVLQALRRNEE